ncbi:MAG: hypothetical protein WC551_09460 [Patescibacteria group bacterium]
MKMETPFYSRVPKDMAGNLRYRAAIHRRVLEDPSSAAFFWDVCSKDLLYYVNVFGYTYDPRRQPFAKLPFITYTFQDEALLEIYRAIGDHDLFIEKSRDMGASWLNIVACEHVWHFKKHQSILFVSRTEDYVDKPDNPKSLFWKLDFFLNSMPAWMRPPGYDESLHRSRLHISNPYTYSVIDGESTTGNVARGDRRTAILLDEFAAVEQGFSVLTSTRDATKCRLFNSTPKGTSNAHYAIRQTGVKKLRLHWSAHPLKAAGLYTTDENGELHVIDKEGYPEGYEPLLDGRLRSPWYDEECKRAANPQEIAQELDIDYQGSGYQFFRAESVHEAIRQYARPPIVVGELEYDDSTAQPIRFREEPNGHLQLWCLLGRDNKPPTEHRYIVAVDVSAGTGSSNSTICAWDAATKEKVLQYANPYIRPEALAFQAVAVCRWLGNAQLIWESNGPGRQFGSRVEELGYMNVYLSKRREAISGDTSAITGWSSTKEGKLVVLGDYRAAIEKGLCVNRSREALEETLDYIFGPDGSVYHSRSSDKSDPTGAKANHGDRVMADALAWKYMNDDVTAPKEETPEVPVGCLAWRNKMREKEKQQVGTELEAHWR